MGDKDAKRRPGGRRQSKSSRAAAPGASKKPAKKAKLPPRREPASPRKDTRAAAPKAQVPSDTAADDVQSSVDDFGSTGSDGLPRPTLAFPIVGIGASAGGLEALETFLEHVPDGSGAAYVIVQHLDPNQKDMLVELLQRTTRLPVLQAADRLRVEREHVYVVPPNVDLSVARGELHLLPRSTPRGLNLPIDVFFRSLAEDQADNGIVVILSGMGSDGTLGARAIKEHAGAVFVQAIGSAKFDGMPRSVIDSGFADVVAPVEELPARILAYRNHTPRVNGTAERSDDKAMAGLEKVFVLLRAHTGNDFFNYKRSTIQRRVARRLGLHQIETVAQYTRFLRENPREIDLLFKELLIGVTNFFRDPAAWEHLKYEALPKLLAKRAPSGVLRAWVPGCSTGEEAYSLAMLFKEAIEPFKPVQNLTLQIFATDLDRDAVEKARQGLYPENVAADVSLERLRRFFVQEDRGFRISKDIREMVVFAPQNVIMDPPFTKLDLLLCRNLMIYLSADLQKKLIPLFHYSLNQDGILFLGSAETVGSFTNLFAPLDNKARLYRKLDQPLVGPSFDFPSAFIAGTTYASEPGGESDHPPLATATNLERLADRLLVQRYAPLGVLCNEKGDVLYVSGRAGKYLEPAVGKANLNIFAMARDGLRYELSSAFGTACRENRTVTVDGISIGSNGGAQVCKVTVQRITQPRELRGTVLVVIADVPAVAKQPKVRRTASSEQIYELEQEVHRAREEVQSAREEMQTSQEELKSTNEELQSANEELQSTNEELTTSKEELQSLNEELQTVNNELQSKVDELSRSNNDMKNLLNSTDIATLFLDGDLRVRRFTTPTARIIKLIADDVGRPITDIASNLDYTELAEDAQEVLRTLVFKERQGSTRDGRWYSIRIMPYRTLENVIDGVVITFTDMSTSRALELSLREQASQLGQMAESLPTLVWGFRPDGSCDYVNRRWVEYTGVSHGELLGYGWLDCTHTGDRERVRAAWRTSVTEGNDFNEEFRLLGKDGSYRWFGSRAVPIRDGRGAILKWYGTSTDVHDLKARVSDAAPADELQDVAQHIREGLFAVDRSLTITAFNAAARRLFEVDGQPVVGQNLFDAFAPLRGCELESKLSEAFRSRSAVQYEAHLDSSLPPGKYRFRLLPGRNSERVVVLFDKLSVD